MKKGICKWFTMILAFIMVFSLFSGCNKQPSDGDVQVLSLKTYELNLKQYEEFELQAYLPKELKGQEVTWTSSDDKKVVVAPSKNDNLMGVLTTLSITKTPVTIMAKCGEQTAKCKVSVIASDIERSIVIMVDDEVVSNEVINVGDTMQLKSVLKENTNAVDHISITYESNSPTKVSVTEGGLITALARGSGIVISANALYKGQRVAARVIVTVKDETRDVITLAFQNHDSRTSTLSAYTGDVVALGFKTGINVMEYNGQTADYTLANANQATHAVFGANMIMADTENNLSSHYDKLVMNVSFPTSSLPYMNFWLGGAEIRIKLPQLVQADGGIAIAFFAPGTKTQVTALTPNTVYTCVINLTQMEKIGNIKDFGFAFVPNNANLNTTGKMYVGSVVACTDYIYEREFNFPTPKGKITKGAYLCYSEVGGYANLPSSCDIKSITSGELQGWYQIDYQRACKVTQAGMSVHEHANKTPTNPVCNRIQPMLPEIKKWSASLGAGGYWNYDYWGLDFILNDKPTGEGFLPDSKNIPQGGEGVIVYFRSGNRDFGITIGGYIVSLNDKLEDFKPEELELFNAQGESIITFNDQLKMYKADIKIGQKYTARIKLYTGHDSYGMGLFSDGVGSWSVNNPFFEKK